MASSSAWIITSLRIGVASVRRSSSTSARRRGSSSDARRGWSELPNPGKTCHHSAPCAKAAPLASARSIAPARAVRCQLSRRPRLIESLLSASEGPCLFASGTPRKGPSLQRGAPDMRNDPTREQRYSRTPPVGGKKPPRLEQVVTLTPWLLLVEGCGQTKTAHSQVTGREAAEATVPETSM